MFDVADIVHACSDNENVLIHELLYQKHLK